MKAVRIGICALVAFAVLSFGAVQPWSRAVVELGAAALFVLWGILSLRRGYLEIHANPLYVPLFGLWLLAAAQCGFGLSAYPYLTQVALLEGGAYILIFFLATESFRDAGAAKPFVWFLLVLGFAVSLFGIVQDFAFNGKLYWLVPLHGGAPFGPYVNRDDFAGFVELVAPLGLALLLFRAVRRDHLALLVLFAVVPIGAAVLSGSRGGIVGLGFEMALLWFLARARRVGRRQITGIAALALLAAAFVVWLGAGAAIRRFGHLRPAEISRNLRVSIYRSTWRIFRRHVWLGTGMGTFPAVYPRYASFDNGLAVEHAHNDYLELLADAGAAGGLLALAFVVLVLRRGLENLQLAQRPASRAVIAGSLAGCAGLLLHSLVDFNLHIPANAMIFILLAGLATARVTDEVSLNIGEDEVLVGIEVLDAKQVLGKGASPESVLESRSVVQA